MDYKQKYNEIPDGYKGEVAAIFKKSQSSIMSKWMNDKEMSKDRRELVNLRVMQVWNWHNLADTMIVEPKKELIVTHLNGKAYIEYYSLMSFRMDTELSECITDPVDIKNILDQSETSIREQLRDNPYSLKVLIAKYIMR